MEILIRVISKILSVIALFVKKFTIDLYLAVKFACLEYDSQLQKTRTPTQRFIIWFFIVATGVVLILFVLNVIATLFLRAINF